MIQYLNIRSWISVWHRLLPLPNAALDFSKKKLDIPVKYGTFLSMPFFLLKSPFYFFAFHNYRAEVILY